MILKKSIESLKRTPYKTAGFLLLIIFSTAFLSLGTSLWQISLLNLAAYEKVFATVGTVRQKENALTISENWDAASKEYFYVDELVYDSFIPSSVLDFEGANYIYKPQQRPYYAAYNPVLRIMSDEAYKMAGVRFGDIIEFTPYEDCIPSEPVKVQVTKVLYGKRQLGTDIWLCDHYTDTPVPLKAGKTYVTSIQTYPNMHNGADKNAVMESAAFNIAVSTQVNSNGVPIAATTKANSSCVEITEGFYQTNEGKAWLEECKALDRLWFHTVPVVPTNSLKLLMPFFNGEAAIQTGREFSKAESDEGQAVCIIPKNLAQMNELKLGDKINLQLYYADYKAPASLRFMGERGGDFSFGRLNAEGIAYPVFEDKSFEVIGIYTAPGVASQAVTGYEMAYNAVIIPSNAVRNSDCNNIVGYGPMQSYNTSFMIENGTVASYMEKFNALGFNNLEIAFYDGGYEQLSSGMNNLKQIAMVLMCVSIVMMLIIILFFAFIFVTKQKRRTAIERSLGLSKKQCAWSLLSGISLLLFIGITVGNAIGYVFSSIMSTAITGSDNVVFSTVFSNWVSNGQQTFANNTIFAQPIVPIIVRISVLVVSFLIIYLFVYDSLKAEPLRLLSQNEE